MTYRYYFNKLKCPACLGWGKVFSHVEFSFYKCSLCKGTGSIFARKSCLRCRGSGVQKIGGLYSLCPDCNPILPKQILDKEPWDYTKLPPPANWPWWDNR